MKRKRKKEMKEKEMNSKIAQTGSAIVGVATMLFAICMVIGFDLGSFFVCMFIAFGFIMMVAGFEKECSEDRKVAGLVALAFAVIYATFILTVYFTQLTTVKNETLTEQAGRVLNYGLGGLMFNFDLLGYGIMAISTFFAGIAMEAKNRRDKWLKWLLILHGAFAPMCFIMPMTGVFINDGTSSSIGGVIALEFWCAYFIPVAVLSFLHFKKNKQYTK